MTTTKVSQLLSYDKGIKLGQGSFSLVYQGLLKSNHGSSRAVAVKRFQIDELSSADAFQQEVKHMQRGGDHPNILRYIRTEKDDNFV